MSWLGQKSNYWGILGTNSVLSTTVYPQRIRHFVETSICPTYCVENLLTSFSPSHWHENRFRSSWENRNVRLKFDISGAFSLLSPSTWKFPLQENLFPKRDWSSGRRQKNERACFHWAGIRSPFEYKSNNVAGPCMPSKRISIHNRWTDELYIVSA